MYSPIKGGQVKWMRRTKKVIIKIEKNKIVKWSDESDNGEVFVNFICII